MSAAPAVLLLALAAAPAAQLPAPLEHVPADAVVLRDPYFAPRIAAWRAHGLPALLDRLEPDGLLANFDRVAAGARGGHRGGPEADARVYEAIQAATLAADDPAVRARVAAIVARVAAAARKGGGYVATYAALETPGARFEDLREGRELFCLGRLIEAALAWERASGDATLLGVATEAARVADAALMAPGALDPPGMPGVELALARLARRVGDEGLLWLADDLVLRRGDARDRALFGGEVQDLVPAQKLFRASGLARSWLALERGMAEVHAGTGEYAMLAAPINGWKDLLSSQAYPHGGVGLEPDGRFPDPPRRVPRLARASAETSVEVAWLARRMLGLTRQSAFADAEERVLFNALSAALPADGRGVLAACPLEAPGGIERRADARDAAALARFLPDLAGGVYAYDDDDLYVAQYLASEARVDLPGGAVRVRLSTHYPWDGRVELSVRPPAPTRIAVHLRVPDWAGDAVRAGVEGAVLDLALDRGGALGMWLTFDRTWTGAETLVLELPLAPRRVRSAEEPGRVLVARGPLLYALEGVDQPAPGALALPPEAPIATAEQDLGIPAVVLRADGRRAPPAGTGGERPGPAAGAPEEPWGDPAPWIAVPYGLIGNRGVAALATWIPEDARDAPPPGAAVERVGARRISASHVHRTDALAALLDGAAPARPDDAALPRVSFLPHRGGREWIEIDLGARVAVAGLRAFVAEDPECAPPAAWRVLRRSGAAWHPCAGPDGADLPAPAAGANAIALDPFVTDALRLELDLRPERSAALFELEIVGG